MVEPLGFEQAVGKRYDQNGLRGLSIIAIFELNRLSKFSVKMEYRKVALAPLGL